MEHPLIHRDPKIMVGKPVIKGTRIPVDLVLRLIAAGSTVEEVLESYPHLTRDQVRAAFAYAADFLGAEEVIFI